MSALDYLDVKLFRYLGIRDVYWDRTSDGTIQGGIGLHASCDDAAKLGLLYLNRGLWNGRRLLSEAWIDAASSLQSQNGPHDWIDWRSGVWLSVLDVVARRLPRRRRVWAVLFYFAGPWNRRSGAVRGGKFAARGRHCA